LRPAAEFTEQDLSKVATVTTSTATWVTFYRALSTLVWFGRQMQTASIGVWPIETCRKSWLVILRCHLFNSSLKITCSKHLQKSVTNSGSTPR